jgi:hypothetical protein
MRGRRKGRSGQIGPALDRLVGRLDRNSGGGYLQTRAAQAWEKIAGKAVTAHTAGAHIRDGKEMVVHVDSPLWATELSALSEHYRRSVNQELGQDLVKSVRFTVSRNVQREQKVLQELVGEEATRTAQGSAEPVPLTQGELAQVEMSVAAIRDEELREAVQKATIADLQYKKGRRRLAERKAASEEL